MIEVKDLTKQELVALVTGRMAFFLKERDLVMVRWETMCGKAKRLREDSMAIGKSPCTRENFYKSTELWDKATAVQKKADDFLAEWRAKQSGEAHDG